MSDSKEEAVSSATGALLWIFLHETGHALADLLDLPLTGREEDAVDQFGREAGASERRLARCEGEHDQFVQSWTALLQPHRIRTRGGAGHTLPQIPTSLGAT